MFPDRTDLPISRILQALRDHKEGSFQGRADLQNAPASSDGSAGSVQPAADAHFRLTTVKTKYPETDQVLPLPCPMRGRVPTIAQVLPHFGAHGRPSPILGSACLGYRRRAFSGCFFYAISFYIWCVSNLFTLYLDFLHFLWVVSPHFHKEITYEYE